MLPEFQISIKIPVPKRVVMTVEQYYATDQVERYKLKYGDKVITIERKLKERQPWKILRANYPEFRPMDFACYLPEIAEQIARANMPPETPYVHPKNMG